MEERKNVRCYFLREDHVRTFTILHVVKWMAVGNSYVKCQLLESFSGCMSTATEQLNMYLVVYQDSVSGELLYMRVTA